MLPGVPGQPPCLFDLVADASERHNIAPANAALVARLWAQLNASVLTTYHMSSSGPAGNPGGISRCSPPQLLGPCNAACAAKYYSRWGGAARTAAEPRVSDSNPDLGVALGPGGATCRMHVQPRTAYRGGGVKVLGLYKAADAGACCDMCQGNRGCNVWVFNVGMEQNCHLKHADGAPVPTQDANCTSGTSAPAPSPWPCHSGAGADTPVCAVPGCSGD